MIFRSLIIILVAIMLIACSCTKDISNFFTNTFSVNVIGDEFYYQDAWIIVGNAEGTSVLAARRVESAGEINFGDFGYDPISLSFVYRDRVHNISYIDSYLNTIGGDWSFVRGLRDSVGSAAITLHFPVGYYDAYSIKIPDGFSTRDRVIGNSTTEWSDTLIVRKLESDDKISILAGVWSWSGSFHFVGWSIGLPFNRGQINSYSVNVNQLLPVHSFSTSRPLDSVWFDCYRSYSCSKYYLSWPEYFAFDQSVFDVNVPLFPADKIRLSGFNVSGNETYYYESTGSEISSSYGIPNGVITANYNSTLDRIEGIQLSGEADAISGVFAFRGETGDSINWQVFTSINSRTIERPLIPDTILFAIGYYNSILNSVSCGLHEYDTSSDYNSYIEIIRQLDIIRHSFNIQHRFGEQGDCLYNTMYQDYRNIY